MNKKKLLIIGGGNMGFAIACGISEKKIYKKDSVVFIEKNKERIAFLTKKGFETFDKLDKVKKEANSFNAIILAVKPFDISEVLKGLKTRLKHNTPLISIAAGIKIKTLVAGTNANQPVARIMPNTPCLIGHGMSAISYNNNFSKKERLITNKIFSSIGKTLELDEKYLDLVTAISGSGPAYFCYLTESLIKSAAKLGLKEKYARELVTQTALGTSVLLSKGNLTAEQLRKMVTSPKGTTEAAMKILLENNFYNVVFNAVKSATNRASQLSRG